MCRRGGRRADVRDDSGAVKCQRVNCVDKILADAENAILRGSTCDLRGATETPREVIRESFGFSGRGLGAVIKKNFDFELVEPGLGNVHSEVGCVFEIEREGNRKVGFGDNVFRGAQEFCQGLAYGSGFFSKESDQSVSFSGHFSSTRRVSFPLLSSKILKATISPPAGNA